MFQRLDPNEFIQCMQAWLESVRKSAGLTDEQLIAIDGQTLKGSADTAFGGRGPLHLVRAWAAEQYLVLGQLAGAEKSNEIEAIPRLLALLNSEGAIVTIDAMGCQTEIAENIIEKQADYILSLDASLHNRKCEVRCERNGLTTEVTEARRRRKKEEVIAGFRVARP